MLYVDIRLDTDTYIYVLCCLRYKVNTVLIMMIIEIIMMIIIKIIRIII